MHIVSHGDTLYTGMMYHEKKEAFYWKSMYSVVRDLDVLTKVYSVYTLFVIIMFL